jgi:hypothetical protein
MDVLAILQCCTGQGDADACVTLTVDSTKERPL